MNNNSEHGSNQSAEQDLLEVEQKYHVDDVASLLRELDNLSATELPHEVHHDRYFNHPSRDFSQTDEALRIRCINGAPSVTYKGPKHPGAIKVREELEFSVGTEDKDGLLLQKLLRKLSFHEVMVVSKTRRSFALADRALPMTVTVDDVQELGQFAEIEVLAADQQQVETAKALILELAENLGLRKSEPKSYLRMVLERSNR